jgi:hypothetical protein
VEHWRCVGGMAAATLKEAAPAMKREQRHFMSGHFELCNRSTTRDMTAFKKKVGYAQFASEHKPQEQIE